MDKREEKDTERLVYMACVRAHTHMDLFIYLYAHINTLTYYFTRA